ncbi:MAG: NAD(P)H-dependent oxidoreductase [Clostridiales bacterium]|nr:NAD(P)H-dependent oxidoreductase [Clostridiales bacterium]
MSRKIGIIAGSLRKGAYTKSVAKAVQDMFPKGWEVTMIEFDHLPLFSQDYEEDGQNPASYTAFRNQIGAQDAFVFVTPEYNRSIPGGLKNALDVASRPYSENKWNGKPAAVISSSIGRIGGFGANHHLRQVMTFLNMPPVQQPEVYLSEVQDMLDEQGNLNSPEVRGLLQSVVDALVKMLEK